MAKLNDNQKSLVILGGGLLLGIGFGVLAYMEIGKTDVVKTEITTLEGTKRKNAEEIARAKPLKNDYVAYNKIVADNSKILPTTDELNQFLRDLGKLENETGVTIKTLPSYSPSPYKNVASIRRIPLQLTLTGTTRNLLKFMNQLENRERMVTVTDIRFSPTSGEVKPGQEREHESTMKFEVYTYDPPAGGAAEESMVGDQERLQLMELKEVREIIERDGKPTFLERYDLMRAREDRRDIFLDPRRRTSGVEQGGGEGIRKEEAIELEKLGVLLEKSRLDYDSFRAAEGGTDFLRRSAARRAFVSSKEALEAELKKVSAKSPEFQSRDLQDKYLSEVKRPYEQLLRDSIDILKGEGGTGPTAKLTEEAARILRGEMQTLVDGRKFTEASDKWVTVDGFARDAGKAIEAGAVPHLDAMRKMGEHARYQTLFAQKRVDVQGVIRMEKRPEKSEDPSEAPGKAEVVAAAIVNGRTLFPGKNLDRDVVFRGVAEDGRLIFEYQGHEVDYMQSKPELLTAQRAILEQE